MAGLPLSNTAEGGTNGTTATGGSGGNTGGTSGDFFDAVTIGTSETLTFDSTTAALGSLSYKIVTFTSVTATYLQYAAQLGTLPTNLTLDATWYYQPPASPTSSVRMVQALSGGSTVQFGVTHASGTGDVAFQVGTTTQAGQTGSALSASTWYRIEAHLTGIGGGTTAGGYSVSVFTGTGATQLGSTITGSGVNLGSAAMDTFRWGVVTANASVSSTYRFDSLTLSLPASWPPADAPPGPPLTMLRSPLRLN